MHAETVRINVTLPKDLIDSVNHIAGPRSRSSIISESLREYLRQMKQDEMEKLLEEGYQAVAKESTVLAEEFEVVDLEGWGEY